ncbi:MAG: inorganic phosphate transporter [Candidatus Aenigmarchaeota archaeon]|nr:inorganic phosphate transporter [Candidatus Aenigmarchaeota archaeon]
MFILLFIAIILALIFSFWTGFTDAAYAISTVIGTRTLKPIQAVALSTIGNLIGMMFGSAVAITIGKGIISETAASGEVIIAALAGALIFDIISSWIYSLPISETHVLIGGLIGGGVAAHGWEVVKFQGIINKVIIPMIFSPFIAMGITFLIGVFVIRMFRKVIANKINKYFKRLEIVSALFFSITDGTNDAQKIMGIMTVLLLYYGYISEFVIPLWVIIASYITLSLGTFLGGWKIVKTMATKITKLKPYQGFSVGVGSSAILGVTAIFGLPVSSTHVANGSIMGVGLCRRKKAVKWGTTRKIVWAWIISMPLAAVFSFIIYNLIVLFV